MEDINSGLFIDGKWIEKHDKIEVRNPYNNELLGKVSKADKDDIKKACKSAGSAFKTFKDYPLHRRASILREIAGNLNKEKERIAKTISLESGKAIRFSKGEVERAIETFNFAANEAESLKGETVPMSAAKTGCGRIGFYMRVPLGPVAAITPFNFPLNLPAHKIAPAIAGGDTIIWKPATLTPLTAVLLTQLIEKSGLPEGALNLVLGSGSEVGNEITINPNVKLISFTGSLEVGRKISNNCGLKKNLMELGSNSAMVIDNEIENLEEIAERAIVGAYANSGQVCISIQRIYVHEIHFEEFCDIFTEKSKNVKIGNPLDSSVLYGPMISEKEAIRAEEWVEEAIKGGATPLLRGDRNGSILYPTILKDVKPEMKVMAEEVFAPVVSVLPFSDFDNATREVNNTIYGLNVGIYTNNVKKVLTAIRDCEVGSVIINDYPTFRVDQMPYGGVKMSGKGREGPPFAIDEYTEIKFVAVK